MAGLLGFLAAGAVKGTGDGIVAEARAKREAAIAALANTRLESRENADRAFRSKEGQLDRSSRSAEAATDREFRSKEGALDRGATAEQNRLTRQETMTGADGTTLVRDGDTARPVKDEKGQPVKTLAKTTDTPADVRTAEWLITQGIAKTPSEAWDKVRTAREGATTATDVEKMVEAAVKTELGDSMVPPSAEKVEESRSRNRTRILGNLGLSSDGPKADKTGAAPAATRPADATDAQIIEEARKAVDGGAPKDAVIARLKSFGIDSAEAGF